MAVQVYNLRLGKGQDIQSVSGVKSMSVAIVEYTKFNFLISIHLGFQMVGMDAVDGKDGVGDRTVQIIVMMLSPIVSYHAVQRIIGMKKTVDQIEDSAAGKSQYLLDNFVIDMIDAIVVRCVTRRAARNAIRCVVHRYVCMASPCAPFLSLVWQGWE